MPWPLDLALKPLSHLRKKFPFPTTVSVSGVAWLIISVCVRDGLGHQIKPMNVGYAGADDQTSITIWVSKKMKRQLQHLANDEVRSLSSYCKVISTTARDDLFTALQPPNPKREQFIHKKDLHMMGMWFHNDDLTLHIRTLDMNTGKCII